MAGARLRAVDASVARCAGQGRQRLRAYACCARWIFYLGSPAEVAIIGDLQDGIMLECCAVWNPYLPNRVVAACQLPGDVETHPRCLYLWTAVGSRATAYVLRNYISATSTLADPAEVTRLLSSETSEGSTYSIHGVQVSGNLRAYCGASL